MKDVTGDAAAVDPHADALLEILDTSQMQGTTCALLTPAIKAKLRELQPGQVLEIRVDDPLARDDIASWCRLAGHELLTTVEEGSRLRVFLRKKPD
jgi:tRNA 2-thiouridine synthesizing protein A